MIKVLIPSDKLDAVLTQECVEWLRSASLPVAEARLQDTELWLEFADPEIAAQFEQIWLREKQ